MNKATFSLVQYRFEKIKIDYSKKESNDLDIEFILQVSFIPKKRYTN